MKNKNLPNRLTNARLIMSIIIIVILLLICIAFICVINKSEKNTYAKEFETEKNVQKSCPLPLNRTTFQRHPGQVFRNIEAYPRFHQFPLLFSAGPAGLREVLFP